MLLSGIQSDYQPIALTDGHLDFGTREQVFYRESDGGRRKRVLVKIIGE